MNSDHSFFHFFVIVLRNILISHLYVVMPLFTSILLRMLFLALAGIFDLLTFLFLKKLNLSHLCRIPFSPRSLFTSSVFVFVIFLLSLINVDEIKFFSRTFRVVVCSLGGRVQVEVARSRLFTASRRFHRPSSLRSDATRKLPDDRLWSRGLLR